MRKFYRCFGDGFVVSSPGFHDGDTCPRCKRKIEARAHGVVDTEQRTVAVFEMIKGIRIEEVIENNELPCRDESIGTRAAEHFENELDSLVQRFRFEYRLSCVEAVGVLEFAKSKIFQEFHGERKQ
jgi:hypothetical protein